MISMGFAHDFHGFSHDFHGFKGFLVKPMIFMGFPMKTMGETHGNHGKTVMLFASIQLPRCAQLSKEMRETAG